MSLTLRWPINVPDFMFVPAPQVPKKTEWRPGCDEGAPNCSNSRQVKFGEFRAESGITSTPADNGSDSVDVALNQTLAVEVVPNLVGLGSALAAPTPGQNWPGFGRLRPASAQLRPKVRPNVARSRQNLEVHTHLSRNCVTSGADRLTSSTQTLKSQNFASLLVMWASQDLASCLATRVASRALSARDPCINTHVASFISVGTH